MKQKESLSRGSFFGVGFDCGGSNAFIPSLMMSCGFDYLR
jgi:hypothetical protein